ncbi:Retrovirus-related Pol polyprotein from transposon TNT 1-94 [Durusdinium trenchii]|uniref:Retrovirus-related Pol polyprotein from transposon TNT 1-94 n=3 Tax=Durusdinium trenchii TaxID=1381693 RepID=A0ABP0K4J4_9DINO
MKLDIDREFSEEMRQLQDLGDPIEEATSDAEAEDAGESSPGDSPKEAAESVMTTTVIFDEENNLLELTQTELVVLKQSWDMLMEALGGERETVGDAIYGILTERLTILKESFKGRPRAIISLNLFNGFRLLCDKARDPEELKTQVETLGFKHLGHEITQQRVDGVCDAFLALMSQNVAELPPGSVNVWQKVLSYTGSCCRYVTATYSERLKIIEDDWIEVLAAAESDQQAHAGHGAKGGTTPKPGAGSTSPKPGGDGEGKAKGGEEEVAVTRSFGAMCSFSMEIIGLQSEGWMAELLEVFGNLVERIGNPSHLMEECELLAISMILKSKSKKEIGFDIFKPVMLTALRSLLPTSWSSSHETAWEWLWSTISRNLREGTQKVRVFKPYNSQLFSALKDQQMAYFRENLYADFFTKCAMSQEIFKQSQTRLHYIADGVLRSSYDILHKPKQVMVDELSALGLRHVGYGIPIELFAPFTDSCVLVIKQLVAEMPKSESMKIVACPAVGLHQAEERDVPEYMMVEGFRWSIGLVARLLMRIITEGSTAVMQAICLDNSDLLQQALREAPRARRSKLQLRVRVGSQTISPLYWALRSGRHTSAKTMLEDILTIRADRDKYYYGNNDIFRYQPNIAADLLQEAPKLVQTLLDGLIWRSHKTQDGLRPVIYYMEHLLQDMDENQMLSRALLSFMHFKDPKVIVHPILMFVLDLLWEKLILRFFVSDQIFRAVNFIIYLFAACFFNTDEAIADPVMSKMLAASRLLVYILGFGYLLTTNIRELWKHMSSLEEDHRRLGACRKCPEFLKKTSGVLSFLLMMNLAVMLTVEPLLHCFGKTEGWISFTCDAWTDHMHLVHEICLVLGIFLYVLLIFGIGSNISITLSEYRVLCLRAGKQVMLCMSVVTLVIFTFGFCITAMTREVAIVGTHEWDGVGSTITHLLQLTVGILDLEDLTGISAKSPSLFVVIAGFLLLVYSFLFNLLVSQFCGVFDALVADSEGHARLARGDVMLDTLKAVPMKKWKHFVGSLALDQRTEFDKGDIGLPGGVKVAEPAGANPQTKDQIIRFGGYTDPSLPWPEKKSSDEDSTKKSLGVWSSIDRQSVVVHRDM